MKRLLLLSLFCATFTLSAQVTLYVDAQKGSDKNNGTLNSPFATLKKARDTVRLLREKKDFSGATIEVTGSFNVPTADKVLNLTS